MAKAREDDTSISGGVRLWRRIPNWPNHSKYDETLKKLRPSSSNFRDDKFNELSVNIADETTIEKILVGYPGFGIAEFTAGLVREMLGATVVICRDPGPDNPGHALICGKVSRPQSEKLAKKCHWVKEPVETSQAIESAHDSVDPDTTADALQSSPLQYRIRQQAFPTPLFVLLLILIAVVIALYLFRN